MSIKLLAPNGQQQRPTVKDDMESLLYVILYCSLLWLPHNLSKKELANAIFEMFDKRAWLVDDFYGGEGKILNATDRQYTQSIMFQEPFREWLQTVMDYHSPATGLYEGHWPNPDQLDSFWGDFLQTRTFQPNDRVVHDHPAANGIPDPPLRSSNYLYSTEEIWLANPSSSLNAIPRKRRARPRDAAAPVRFSKRLRAKAEHASGAQLPLDDPAR